MDESQRVLSLYAPNLRRELDLNIEMRIKVFPYTSQAHFLVETLKECKQFTREPNIRKPKIYKSVSLEDNELIANLTRIDMVRMFFGFHPSEAMVAKLRELEIDDERTQQILSSFRHLDEDVNYTYLCTFNPMWGPRRYALLTKKSELENLRKAIPKRSFFSGRPVPGNLWFPIKPTKDQEVAPSLHSEIDLRKLQKALYGQAKPFIILTANSYYSTPVNMCRERLPPSNLDLIDCFPHKNSRWKNFLESEGEYKPSPNFLVEMIEENIARQRD